MFSCEKKEFTFNYVIFPSYSYVFANNHRRLAYGEMRGEVATLDPKWRTNHDTEGPQKVTCTRHGKWVSASSILSCTAAGGATDAACSLAQPPAGTVTNSIFIPVSFFTIKVQCKKSGFTLSRFCKMLSTFSWELRDY